MVNSVNGDRGSSVIPIGGDDYMFLGRGRHVWLDNNDVHFSGSSGQTLADGIATSGNSKKAQMAAVGASMKIVEMEPLSTADDYLMKCCGHTVE